jgi:hypothetical protein
MPAAKRDPTEAFFEALAARSHEPMLRSASGCTRMDVVDGRKVRRWYVSLDGGTITVSRQEVEPTCVVRADKAVFDKVVRGRLNAVAAVLRGEIQVEGDWRLLVRLQRLFPSPRRSARR